MKFIAIGLGLYITVVIPLAIIVHGCAHVDIIPTRCDGQQLRDPDHRVIDQTLDCYKCLDVAPGMVDQGGHYRCLDYTCNECETPIVPFGRHRPDASVAPQRDAP